MPKIQVPISGRAVLKIDAMSEFNAPVAWPPGMIIGPINFRSDNVSVGVLDRSQDNGDHTFVFIPVGLGAANVVAEAQIQPPGGRPPGAAAPIVTQEVEVVADPFDHWAISLVRIEPKSAPSPIPQSNEP